MKLTQVPSHQFLINKLTSEKRAAFDRTKFVRATSFIKVFMPWVATKEFTIYHSVSVDVVQEFVFLFIQYA